MSRDAVLAEWRRALEAQQAAEFLARHHLEADSISRAYYAILHAAKAALQSRGIAAESHAAVKRLFGLHLIRPGDIEAEWATAISESSDDRLTADYDVLASFSPHDARSECARARAFLRRIRRHLRANGFSASDLAIAGRT